MKCDYVKLFEKYHNGDRISDDELVLLIDKCDFIDSALSGTGEMYKLVRANNSRMLWNLISYRESRERNA